MNPTVSETSTRGFVA